MEKTKVLSTGYLSMAVVVAVMIFASVVIAYGMDNILAGAHDVFHDFRHTFGMPCH